MIPQETKEFVEGALKKFVFCEIFLFGVAMAVALGNFLGNCIPAVTGMTGGGRVLH